MKQLEWMNGYRTGIESLDHEHRLLIDAINVACDALAKDRSRDTVSACLGHLHQRMAAHFALEEKAMRESRYPLYALHKAEHERLLQRMRVMMNAFEDSLCDGCDCTLGQCLVDWFGEHFEVEDGRLKALRAALQGTRV